MHARGYLACAQALLRNAHPRLRPKQQQQQLRSKNGKEMVRPTLGCEMAYSPSTFHPQVAPTISAGTAYPAKRIARLLFINPIAFELYSSSHRG